MKLKINIVAGIYSIVAAVLFAASWFVVISEAVSNGTSNSGTFFYIIAWIGVIINIYAMYASKKAGITLTGSVLGLIGNALFGFTAALAFPAIVVLIVAAVFQFLQRPKKDN